MHYDKGLFGKPSLDSFLLFLDSQHIPHAPGKGEYQLAQVWLNNAWLAITVDGKGLISTPVELRPLIEQFKNPVLWAQQAQQQSAAGVTTFTGFCQQANGQGTIWIESFQVPDNDVALACKRARDLCAEAWGYPPSDVHVLGIAEGNVNILAWEDLNDD